MQPEKEASDYSRNILVIFDTRVYNSFVKFITRFELHTSIYSCIIYYYNAHVYYS